MMAPSARQCLISDQLSFSYESTTPSLLCSISSPTAAGSTPHTSSSNTITLHTRYRRLGQLMANVNLEAKPRSTLIFSPSLLHGTPCSIFGPRVGLVSVQRQDGTASVAIRTPGMVTATSRGVVPHLSRDHVRLTKAIRWVHVPFESL